VTITWNESAGRVVQTPAALTQQQQQQGEVRVRRFDLGIHHDPFVRNFYSSAFSTDKLKRFNLPSNSALVSNPEAVILTGPGLFPKLMDYKEIQLQDRERNLQFSRQTLVLRELSQGITNRLRVSNLVGKEWVTDKQIVFIPPVCPVSF
jgi:hypothetical protein